MHKVYANLMIDYHLQKAWKLHLNKFMRKTIVQNHILWYNGLFLKNWIQELKSWGINCSSNQYWKIILVHICNWNIQEHNLDWIHFAMRINIYVKKEKVRPTCFQQAYLKPSALISRRLLIKWVHDEVLTNCVLWRKFKRKRLNLLTNS